jgi:peptidoglycan hydrolase-like amidase
MPPSPSFSVRRLRCALLLACALSGFGRFAPPAGAQDLFRQRSYRVRIGVAEDMRRVVVQGTQNYTIHSNDLTQLGQLGADQPYYVDYLTGQPGAKLYRLVLHEFDPHAVDAAVELARRTKESHQLPAKVFRIPSREPGGGRILVTLGEFPTLEAARERAGKLDSEKVLLIYEDRATAVKGEVRLFDANGTILARDPKRLRLSPTLAGQGNLAVQAVEGESVSPTQLSSARRYRGDMDLMINKSGTLTVVNDLWIEYYLYSVVGAEIGTDSPTEGLKAQAVAARSEAVAKIERQIVSSEIFDFYDTAIAQAYPGRKSESDAVRRAVDATRGEILVHDHQPVDAVYGHSCGGYIASSLDMWDGKQGGISRRHLDRLAVDSAPDLSLWRNAYRFLNDDEPSLCNPSQKGFPAYARRYYRWEKYFTGEEFTRLANAQYGTGTVKDVYIDERSPGGRIRKLRIIGEKKTIAITQELEMRRALGSIYSTFFALGKDRDDDGILKGLRINGGGYGHGVGMCQMGALTMARRGYNYRQILAHYYTDVEIRRLYR